MLSLCWVDFVPVINCSRVRSAESVGPLRRMTPPRRTYPDRICAQSRIKWVEGARVLELGARRCLYVFAQC